MSLVTIASYRDPHTAHIARVSLESEGIPAFVAHEYHVGVNWQISLALGGVKVQVPSRHVEPATDFLRSDRSSELALLSQPPDASELCPNCASPRIEVSPFERRTKALSMLIGFPFAYRCGFWRCTACGHTWRLHRSYRSIWAVCGYLLAFVLYLFDRLLGLVLLVPAQVNRLIPFRSRTYRCWSCGASYTDATTCPRCSILLPSPAAYEKLVVPGTEYDAACPNCHVPYRREDYDPDAVHRCSWCRTELPL